MLTDSAKKYKYTNIPPCWQTIWWQINVLLIHHFRRILIHDWAAEDTNVGAALTDISDLGCEGLLRHWSISWSTLWHHSNYLELISRQSGHFSPVSRSSCVKNLSQDEAGIRGRVFTVFLFVWQDELGWGQCNVVTAITALSSPGQWSPPPPGE